MALEFDHQKCRNGHLTWSLNHANLPRRPDLSGNCQLHLPRNNTVFYQQCNNVADQSCQSLSARSVPCVTVLATVLTVLKMSVRPILAWYKHDNTICAQYYVNSPTTSKPSLLQMMIVGAWRRRLLQLRHTFICQLTMALHTVFCVAFHDVTPG